MALIRKFITYIKNNSSEDLYYSGHASGNVDENLSNIDAAKKIMRKRDYSHHKNKDGFGIGIIDNISTNKDAIIGREQILHEHFKSQGKSGNRINPINPKKKEKTKRCKTAAHRFFGLF